MNNLLILGELMEAVNHRYLKFLSVMEDPIVGLPSLEKISQPVQDGQRSFGILHFFDEEDHKSFEASTQTGPQILRILNAPLD